MCLCNSSISYCWYYKCVWSILTTTPLLGSDTVEERAVVCRTDYFKKAASVLLYKTIIVHALRLIKKAYTVKCLHITVQILFCISIGRMGCCYVRLHLQKKGYTVTVMLDSFLNTLQITGRYIKYIHYIPTHVRIQKNSIMCCFFFFFFNDLNVCQFKY